VLSPADQQVAEGRQTGRLGRPISDCPGELDGEPRRAWRAGWLLGRDEYVENRAVWAPTCRPTPALTVRLSTGTAGGEVPAVTAP
jgi:hypothetical protein